MYESKVQTKHRKCSNYIHTALNDVNHNEMRRATTYFDRIATLTVHDHPV